MTLSSRLLIIPFALLIGCTFVATDRTQEAIERAEFLFHIELAFQIDLDKYIISDDLYQKFRNNEILLSQDAHVPFRKEGSQWLITDHGKSFFVIKEESHLSIYLNTYQVKVKDVPLAANALLSDRVNAVAADTENIWIATDKGVSRLIVDQNIWTSYTVENGLANKNVSRVAIDADTVWFGTESGVSKYDVEEDRWRTYTRDDGLPSNRITAVGVDGNYVWFGTDKGLARYNKTIDVWALRTTDDGGLISNQITAIAVEEEYVWFATDKGISRYDKKIDSWTQLTTSEGLAEDNVTTIAIDQDFIWFGTQNAGVSVYSKTDQTFVKTYTRDDLLKSNKINHILVDGLSVWIGTANEGVPHQVFFKEHAMKWHRTRLAADSRYVWIPAQMEGRLRYDKLDDSWKRYTAADGLSSGIGYVIVDDDNVWAYGWDLCKYDRKTDSWIIIDDKRGWFKLPFETSSLVGTICGYYIGRGGKMTRMPLQAATTERIRHGRCFGVIRRVWVIISAMCRKRTVACGLEVKSTVSAGTTRRLHLGRYLQRRMGC